MNSRDERYAIVKSFGEGAFASVYLAEDRLEHRRVAVKIVQNNLDAPLWLSREFDILSRLSHPNIVRVYEKFVLHGHLHFAMEHIDGLSLMRAVGAPCGDRLSSVGIHATGQLQNALDYLHENGIVHGELSPGNILVDRDGNLKLIDFELCYLLAPEENDMRRGKIIGTPVYMSPEHLAGHLRAESDYFVVGTLLIEALMGHTPLFSCGGTLDEIFHKIDGFDPRLIPEIQTDIAPDLREIIFALMDRDPASRVKGWESLSAVTRHCPPIILPESRRLLSAVPGSPKAFLSHASVDKTTARRLALALAQAGVDVWLDEWEIQVGQSISRKIDDALTHCAYVILLLSPAALASKWVEREWRAAFWREMDSGEVVVLPVLAAKCAIPVLLCDKKYADLSQSFDDGVQKLLEAFEGQVSSKATRTK